MKHGTPVEIKKVWAHGEDPVWFGGYTYIRPVNDKAPLVEGMRGVFAGMPFSMLNADIRPARC